MQRITLTAAVVMSFAFASPRAQADLVGWKAAADGAGASFSEINVTTPNNPVIRDIGSTDETTGGGITYEFIVNGAATGISSAILGVQSFDAVTDAAAFKFEQWNNTGEYGVSVFGVTDIDYDVPLTENTDVMLTFVNDGSDTELFVNGVSVGTRAVSPELDGSVGIGAALNAGTPDLDVFDGSVLGVAIYDSALSSGTIAANHSAFIAEVPAPAALPAGLALIGVIAARRRR